MPYLRYSEYGGFVQDQWRATIRLTLNLGLRYDLFTPVSERYNRLSDFLLGFGNSGAGGTKRHFFEHSWHPETRFQPAHRCWLIGSASKTVIRGAYGLFYFNEEGSGGSSRLFINYPFAAQFTVSCSATAPCLSTSAEFPQTLSANNLPTAVYQPSTNLTPNMQQWNTTLERQVGSGTGAAGRLRWQPWQPSQSEHQ